MEKKTVNIELMKMLRDLYLEAKDEKQRRSIEIRNRHAEQARIAASEEIDAMADVVDTPVGEMLVRVLGTGLKRKNIWKDAFGSNDNDRWTRLVRLGGGEVRGIRTGAEIVAQAAAASEQATNNLLDRLGVKFLGRLAPFGPDYTDQVHPCFEIIETGTTFFMELGYPSPYGDDFDVTRAWLRENREDVRELNDHYREEGE